MMGTGFFDRRALSQIPWVFLMINLGIVLFGLATLYSATSHGEDQNLTALFRSQLLWFLIGLVVMCSAALVDYRHIEKLTWFFYALNVACLVFVLVEGRYVAGSRRWIHLGFLTFQPSELMKITLIVTMAKLFSYDHQRNGYGLRDLAIPIVLTAIPALLVLKEPDLGTALLLGLIVVFVFVYIGMRWKILIGMTIAFLSAAPVLWMFILKDYQKGRVLTFLDPSHDPLGKGYHIIQSIITIGSGRTYGKGFLLGTQNQLGFIPKPHTDFIFSVFAEEWGFFGCSVVLLLYLFFLLFGLSIAAKARDRFGAVLSIGIIALFFWQIVVNIGMEIGIMPVVGVTLPFFSYGGSAMLINLLSTGLLVNVAMHRHIFTN